MCYHNSLTLLTNLIRAIVDSELIYLDNNASTQTDKRVVDSMMPYFTEIYGNASSLHEFGQRIKKDIQLSREKVSKLINAESNDVIFTSGGTESINLGLKGYAFANQPKGNHIITCATEHKAVLDTCKYLETVGFQITYLPVNHFGILDINNLKKSFTNETILVCLMMVNNETGVLQPIKQVSEITHDAGSIFMCDASQAFGKISIDVNELGIDIMPFSGHKFYGPKGIGGLYIKGLPKKLMSFDAIQHGGGHEMGLRSGTLNVPGIIGLGAACEIAEQEMMNVEVRVGILRDKLEEELLRIKGAYLNGDKDHRLYNTINICFTGEDANVLIGRMKNIAASTGAACSSMIVEPSHVLKAMGLSDEDSHSSIRFSLSKYNTEEEMERTITLIYQLMNH